MKKSLIYKCKLKPTKLRFEFCFWNFFEEAIKCMHHSRRTKLTIDDIDGALNLRNVEPVYGFTYRGPLRFKRAIGHRDLFYIDDKDVELKDVVEAPLPKAPLETSIFCHWLAIDGVQPAIPHRHKDDGLPIEVKLPVKHVLSRELQLYFDKIIEFIVSQSDSTLFKEALVSLATNSGLHPLVSYFTCFVADEASHGLNDYQLLFALMRVLHQLMPSVVTCLVARRLGNRFADNHWELRDFTTNLAASICKSCISLLFSKPLLTEMSPNLSTYIYTQTLLSTLNPIENKPYPPCTTSQKHCITRDAALYPKLSVFKLTYGSVVIKHFPISLLRY
ncbi:hypothetical protein UlMin_037486 [Ulmus minor]